jgi:diguanylate cyclase (GGDEF)-like protein
MDGLTFTAKARQVRNQNKLCIIGISGSDQKDLSAQFLKQGANDFISKPYSYDEITCRVNQNLNMLAYFEEINKIANMDFLTELPNRRYFFNAGEQLLNTALANKQHIIVVILDIDFFKLINDNYGHDFGDEALKHISNVIQDTLGNHIIARLGGEEFGFIIQESNFAISSALIERLRLNIQENQLMYENSVVNITASIGATYEPQKSLEDMLQVADEHLYLAKQSGRNKVVWNHNKPILNKK